MTTEEMRAYALSVVEGGSVKKADVIAFMKAYLEAKPQVTEEDLKDLEVDKKDLAELTKVELDGRDLPTLWFEIEKTESGIHVPREANRSYSTREGYALLAMLTKALNS